MAVGDDELATPPMTESQLARGWMRGRKPQEVVETLFEMGAREVEFPEGAEQCEVRLEMQREKERLVIGGMFNGDAGLLREGVSAANEVRVEGGKDKMEVPYVHMRGGKIDEARARVLVLGRPLFEKVAEALKTKAEE